MANNDTTASHTLTLDDINGSETLRRRGALAGDTVKDNELVRVWSEESDSRDGGYIVTNEDIAGSATLQERKAVAGDRIIDNELHSSEKDSLWSQFVYGYDKMNNVVANATDVVSAKFPMGIDFGRMGIAGAFTAAHKTASSDLIKEFSDNGIDFSGSSEDERRDLLIGKRERELQETVSQFFVEDEEGLAGKVGGFVGAMADPTSLIPVGQGYKAMALGSAALGGAFSAAEDLAQTGEVDPVKAGMTALGAGVLAPATVLGARLAGKGLSKTAKKTKEIVNTRKDKGASKVINEAQAIVDKEVAAVGHVDDLATVLQEAGMNPAKVQAATTRVGRKLRVGSQDRAQRAIDGIITRDSAFTRTISPPLDKYLGAISTRIGVINARLKGQVRSYEFKTAVRTSEALNEAQPFLQTMHKLAEPVKDKIGLNLMNGRFDDALVLMKQQAPELAETFESTIIPQLKRFGTELKESGHQLSDIPNYFPRLVKDVKGLHKALGKEETGTITDAIKDYAKRKNIRADAVTDAQRAEVTDLTLRGYKMVTTDGGKPRFVKPRKLQTVEPRLQKFYASPEESLSMYLRGASDDIETRAFLGRSHVGDEMGETDVDKSLGTYIDQEIQAGRVKPEQQVELKGLFSSRFIGGKQTAHKANNLLKNLGYIGTIANPLSAMVQLSDNAHSATLYGLRNTVSSMLSEKDVKLVDLGLDQMITADMGAPITATAKVLAKLMKVSGFTTVDKLGKETLINSSLKFAQASVKNPKQFAKFKQKHEAIYGDEFPSLVKSLEDGNIDENVKMFLFNELADIQPIALSEFPQGYLDNPNGRILYMLKSFTLKQYDIVRRNVVQEYAKGNKAEALKNATALAGYLTAANVTVQTAQDMLLGREVHPEDIPSDALWSLLGVFGLNKYTNDKYLQRGQVTEAVWQTLRPATPLIDSALKLGGGIAQGEPEVEKILREVPIIGEFIYNWFGGGAEEYNERKAKERKSRQQ